MTNTEFLALEFGSVVFDKDGVKGAVINTFHDDDISVCFNTATGSDRVRLIRFEEADTIFLEKPKKKVKKEVSGGASLTMSGQVCVYGVDVFELRNILKRTSTIPVTITYETEE